MIRVALDAMGADAGVEPVVEGACRLSLESGPIHVTLVGDPRQIERALGARRADRSRLAVVAADGAVRMTDKPVEALDRMPGCSVLTAARLVRDGQADALVSAGNTGAVILAAARSFARIPGIRRVALAAVYPTALRHGPRRDPFALMLDVGATLGCTAEELVGFAVMGSAYSRVVSQIERPRVALLSNGSEPQKGTPAVVAAHAALARLPSIEFVGNVEGVDIPRGTVDVVVCDGFVGNIVLKMLEGVAAVALDLARKAYERRLLWRLGLGMLSRGLRQLQTLTDWKQYGGAPIVGFDHVVIKAHGRSNAQAIRNALKVAAKAVERGLEQQIRTALEPLGLAEQ
ncbi:MAG: phosphate acyltransferase PlsX [Myxococcales bacterium]|nr:phosphate acyltransferase PlsX [Myxococcales bacterium]